MYLVIFFLMCLLVIINCFVFYWILYFFLNVFFIDEICIILLIKNLNWLSGLFCDFLLFLYNSFYNLILFFFLIDVGVVFIDLWIVLLYELVIFLSLLIYLNVLELCIYFINLDFIVFIYFLVKCVFILVFWVVK